MESRPLLQSSQRSATEMDSQVSLCLPAILSNSEGCKEGGAGQSKNNINYLCILVEQAGVINRKLIHFDAL